MGDNVAMIKGGNCNTDAIHVSKITYVMHKTENIVNVSRQNA